MQDLPKTDTYIIEQRGNIMTAAKRTATSHGSSHHIHKLTPGQRNNATQMLSNIVRKELLVDPASNSNNPNGNPACPHCGSLNMRKRGKDSRKRQRYQCKNCEKSSTQDTSRYIASSKLPLKKWLLFIECYVDFLSLRDTARACGVCLKTAFNMRHRMLKAIQMHCPSSLAVFHAYGNENTKHRSNYQAVRVAFVPAPGEVKNRLYHHSAETNIARIPLSFPRNQAGLYMINGDFYADKAEATNVFARICLNAAIERIAQNNYRARFLESGALAEFIAKFRRTTNQYRVEYATWLSWLYLIEIADSANRFSARVMQWLDKQRDSTASSFAFEVSFEPFVRYWADIVSGV